MVDLSIVFCMFTRPGINGSEFWFQRLKSGVHFNGEAAAMGASRPRQQEAACETRMRMFDERKPQNLQICQRFYLFVAIIVISWE